MFDKKKLKKIVGTYYMHIQEADSYTCPEKNIMAKLMKILLYAVFNQTRTSRKQPFPGRKH